jgi:shikimate dehydrogenase
VTQLAGVIGHPISHSLSPAIHNAALRHDGRDASYMAFDVRDVDPDELADQGFVGVNVTIPHKRRALEVAAWRSAEAADIGAANTLVFADGVRAYNTDPQGVLGGLRDLGVTPEGKRCLVVGAGGAGIAAAWALRSAGAGHVLVANRTPRPEADVPWEGVNDTGAEILVHATSVGMAGEDTFLQVRGYEAVLDLVYARGETDLVRKAAAAGIPAADGLGVLVHQAAAAYELFWDAPAPFDVMLEAASRATGRS